MVNILINVNVNKICQFEFTHGHIIYSKYTVAKTSESENKETQRKKVFQVCKNEQWNIMSLRYFIRQEKTRYLDAYEQQKQVLLLLSVIFNKYINKTEESFLVPSAMWIHSEKTTIYEQEAGTHQTLN